MLLRGVLGLRVLLPRGSILWRKMRAFSPWTSCVSQQTLLKEKHINTNVTNHLQILTLFLFFLDYSDPIHFVWFLSFNWTKIIGLLRGGVPSKRGFPNLPCSVPQSSQTESLGFPSYPPPWSRALRFGNHARFSQGAVLHRCWAFAKRWESLRSVFFTKKFEGTDLCVRIL